ncbi:MAG: PQQ-binding-like beta-propeller repeat protein [Candidatus Latescibacteria bacterium]|nr:PQQ-binding-like beta-propeller repeat protein [Candidatus Latescibacterota bacterium]
MKRIIIKVFLVCITVNACFASDWPQYRADAGRSGYTPEQLSENLSLRWIHKSDQAPEPAWKGKDTRMPFDHAYQPVISGGMLFYGSSADCKVYALDASNGKVKWSCFTDSPVRFAPAVWKDRVFVVSDDGFLYCFSVNDGALIWKKRGGPDTDKVLGNDRMISRWPARGGVVIDGDILYFGAGVWPSDGIYIYAVDPASGKVLWINDDSGDMEMDKPHPGARAKSGVSCHGYLAVSGNNLIVPTGRGVPAAFDRNTGEFKYFHHQKHRAYGGSRVVTFGGYLFTDSGNDRQTTTAAGTAKGVFYAADGELATDDPIPTTAVAFLPGYIIYADQDAVHAMSMNNLLNESQIQDRQGNTVTQKHLNPPSWSVETPADPGGISLITAGNSIISGTTNHKVTIIDTKQKKVVWSARVDGVPHGLAVADGCLYVSADTGTLYCFDASGTKSPKVTEFIPDNQPYGDNTRYARLAEDIIDTSVITEGYCLDMGCGDGRLSYELAKRTNLFIYAVDPDPKNVASAREKLDAAGLYGTRVTVLQADPKSTSLPDYFANLIVSGRSAVEGPAVVSEKEIQRIQRPYGGVICIGKQGALKKSVRGALTGAGNWTHQYHDPANTITSEDELIQSPLGMQWFRDDDFDVPSRHGRGVAPLVSNGRLFVEGLNAIRCIDAYNGRTIWEMPLRDIQKAYDQEHLVGVAVTQSNICIDGDRLYIRTGGVHADGDYAGRSCLVLDAITGKKLNEFSVPAAPDGSINLYWGYVAVEDGILYGSLVDTQHVVNYAYRESDMNTLFSESIYFFAMDADTGELKWSYTPEHSIRHNAIAIGKGRVYLVDRPQAETDRIRNPHKRVNPEIEQPQGKLLAFDARSGNIIWENGDNIYGTLLALSTPHDVLLMTYQFTRFRQFSEKGGQMTAYGTKDGSILWDTVTGVDASQQYPYSSRPIINGRTIYLEPGAWDILTGEKLDFEFKRTYACGIMASSKNTLLFRSGTLGYVDLTTNNGTENFGGFRPGCWINAIPAGGLVLVPDFTDRCNCSYLNKASVALRSY